MALQLKITPTAKQDLEDAVLYYNSRAADLGYRFAETINSTIQKIALQPAAAAVRYKDIRCKPVYRFPYLILYQYHAKEELLIILRIFHTRRQPLQ